MPACNAKIPAPGSECLASAGIHANPSGSTGTTGILGPGGNVVGIGSWGIGLLYITNGEPGNFNYDPGAYDRTETVIYSTFSVGHSDLFIEHGVFGNPDVYGNGVRVDVSVTVNRITEYVSVLGIVLVNLATGEEIDASIGGTGTFTAYDGVFFIGCDQFHSTLNFPLGRPLGTVSTVLGITLGDGWRPLVTTNTSRRVTFPFVPSNPPSTTIPLISSTSRVPTTIVTSPARSAGCNLGGVGWKPSYTGPSGVVPVGADPIYGELLTGKRIVRVWAEVNHDDGL